MMLSSRLSRRWRPSFTKPQLPTLTLIASYQPTNNAVEACPQGTHLVDRRWRCDGRRQWSTLTSCCVGRNNNNCSHNNVPYHGIRNVPLSQGLQIDLNFSTSSSDPPKVEVTVTSSEPNNESNSESNNEDNIHHCASQSSSDGPSLKKSADQEMEELILSIQSTLRAHHRHADFASALTTATELLAMTKDHFGVLHPATASAYNNVGLMNKLLGNYVEAREAYHESLRIYGEVCGKDHASYAAALSNLGMLERGRVLESEAEEGSEEEEKSGDSSSQMDGSGNDEEAGPKPKPKLSALERMQLNETAIEYFDEAYRIRLAELGSNHPHTITSRSQLGSAMAASVIAERKGKVSGLVEGELRQLKAQKDIRDSKEMEEYVPLAVARAAAKSSSQSKLSQRRWDAAEEHLRGALATAVENPRGESVRPLTYLPESGDSSKSTSSDNQRQKGLTLPPKNVKPLSKKEKRMAGKERKREKRRANMNSLQGDSADDSDGDGKIAVQGAAGKVTTLSAATAAQNLAVFLKNYSDWMRLTLAEDADISDGGGQLQQEQQKRVRINKVMLEAHHLYESALHVRSSILIPSHPEVVATKFSLAELLDSPKVSLSPMKANAGKEEEGIDSKRATALREEILSAYEVSELEEEQVSRN